MSKFLSLFFFFALSLQFFFGFSQNQIQKSPNLDLLVSKHIEYNQSHPPQGFRLVLFVQSGNHSKAACNEAKNIFLELYPFENAYVIYEEPYFKLKVGNFRIRMEAQRFLDEIKGTYPQAYIVKDNLDVTAFLDIINSEASEINIPKESDTEF